MARGITCPECGAEYKDNRGLTTHRRWAHGYVSQTRGAEYQRRARAAKEDKPEKANDHEISSIEEVIDISYAVGRTEEFIRHLAESSGRPEREFTQRVVSALHRKTGRSVLGDSHALPHLRSKAA